MSTKVVGNINVALIFGLLQFVSTFLIAFLYGRYMNGKVDPLARKLEQRYNDEIAAGGARDELRDPLHDPVPRRRRDHHRHHLLGEPADQDRRRLLRRRPQRSAASRTAWPSPATTCRPRRSSASPALIALSGYDGFLYSIGFLVAWLVALLLVAELLRNSGRYTMADQLAFRMRQRPVRTAAATSTVVVSIFYLLAQMVGAGALVDAAARHRGRVGAQASRSSLVGLLMIFYVVVGGMKGTTWVQIVKAVLLMTGTILITVLVLAKFDFNLCDLLGAAAEQHRQGRGVPRARAEVRHRHHQPDRLRRLALALVLGTAGLPHILIRFYTVPTAKDARTSVNWAIGLIGAFYLMTLVLGLRCRGAAGHRSGQ